MKCDKNHTIDALEKAGYSHSPVNIDILGPLAAKACDQQKMVL